MHDPVPPSQDDDEDKRQLELAMVKVYYDGMSKSDMIDRKLVGKLAT